VIDMGKRRKVAKGERSNTVGEKTLDEKLAKAMGHPVRAQIVSYLEKNGVSSPKEMARAGIAEEKLSNVAYHVRILEEYGCVELVEEEPVRGSTAHYYRATTRMLLDIDAWRKLNKSTKKAVSIVAVQETIEGISEAMEQDTFDSFDERNVMNLRRQVDKEGFLAAAQKMHEFMEWFDDLEAECLQRARGSDGDQLFPMAVNMLLYEAARMKAS
jgi:DNA-binding transcriptional ArsR family regulator